VSQGSLAVPDSLVPAKILSDLRKATESASSLVIFRQILEDPVVARMIEFLDLIVHDRSQSWQNSRKLAEAYALFFSALAMKAASNREAPVGNPWQNHLLDLVLSDENAFSRRSASVHVKAFGSSLIQQVEEDLRKLRQLYLLESVQIQSALKNASPESTWVGWDQLESSIPDEASLPTSRRTSLKQHLHVTANWDSCIDRLAEFYSSAGVGIFSQFRAFHWKPAIPVGSLEGIESVDPIRLEDLVGCDDQKE